MPDQPNQSGPAPPVLTCPVCGREAPAEQWERETDDSPLYCPACFALHRWTVLPWFLTVTPSPGAGGADGVVEASYDDYDGPGDHVVPEPCSECGGRGSQSADGVTIDCPECMGYGVLYGED